MKKLSATPVYDRNFLLEVITTLAQGKNRHSGVNLLFGERAEMKALYFHREQVASKLSGMIRKQTYQFEPACAYVVNIEGKERILYRQTLLDRVVEKAAAILLHRSALSYYSDHLYSYQKGKGPHTAVRQLRTAIQHHVKRVTDVKKRGLYVLRRDVSAYGESIPTSEGSYLWERIHDIVSAADDANATAALLNIVRQCICRKIISIEGQASVMSRGTPTGSSIQPVVNNLYLHGLDQKLSGVSGGFYARYGDDFIFAHADAAVAQDTASVIDAEMAALGLHIREEKRENQYVTGCGKRSELWPQARGATRVTYLGCCVGFDGTVSLPAQKIRSFIADVRMRISHVLSLLPSETSDERGKATCAALNRAYQTDSLVSGRYISLLRHVVDDRRQLRHIDYLVALEVACQLSGRRSVKAFRQFPYRMIRREFGLLSLVSCRNRRKKTTCLK